MANQQGSFLTAIDVGSAKTCALMAEVTEHGLRYRGHGVAESRGSRKGVIVELDKAIAAIQKAVEAAEDAAGAESPQAASTAPAPAIRPAVTLLRRNVRRENPCPRPFMMLFLLLTVCGWPRMLAR